MSPLLFALFLATFAIGTTEFAVVGLLPDIAASLDVSISQTGLLVSGYAIGVAIGGPVIVALTSSQPRKRTLLQLCAIFVVGHALAALAPDYGWLMGARVLAALSHASFLGIAAIVAAGSVRLSAARAPCLSSSWVSPLRASSACRARPQLATRLDGAPRSGCSWSLA
jgi:MFS transporter, DHA1 family, inner membrane transport protein